MGVLCVSEGLKEREGGGGGHGVFKERVMGDGCGLMA